MNINIDYKERFEAIIEKTRPIMKEFHKEKIHDALKNILGKISTNSISLAVCGEAKKGKSTFINAFIGEDICPTDNYIATSAVTIIKYGKNTKLTRFYSDEGEIKSETIDYESISDFAKGSAMNIDNTVMIIVEKPIDALKDGLTIIDTPGVGGLDPRHLFLTLYALPKADAAIFMLDASEPTTVTELNFLKEKILDNNKNCTVLINRIAEEDPEDISKLVNDTKEKIVRRCNLDLNVIPFDAILWQEYNETKDEDFKTASNCDAVLSSISRLRKEFKTSQLHVMKRYILSTLESIKDSINTELSSITDNSESRIKELKHKMELLLQLKNNLQSNNSEVFNKIKDKIRDSKKAVTLSLSNDSIFLSSDKLTTILSDERATDDDGEWVIEQLNKEIQELSEQIDKQINEGFESVINDIPDVIQEQFELQSLLFDGTIIADLAPQIKSLSDKISDATRQALPILGVSTLAGGAVYITGGFLTGFGAALGISLGGATMMMLAGPVGIAAGIWYICKNIKKASRQERLNQISNKLKPRITAVVTNLRAHIDNRYDEFEKALKDSLSVVISNISDELSDIQKEVLKCNEEHDAFDKRKKDLNQKLSLVNTFITQTNLLLTNPFETSAK